MSGLFLLLVGSLLIVGSRRLVNVERWMWGAPSDRRLTAPWTVRLWVIRGGCHHRCLGCIGDHAGLLEFSWHLRSTAQTAGSTIATIAYGAQPGDVPVPGDWDGDGDDEPGIYRRGTWHFRSTASTAGGTVGNVRYGVSAGDVPLAGNWDADAPDEPAIYRGGEFHLRGTAPEARRRFTATSSPPEPVVGRVARPARGSVTVR